MENRKQAIYDFFDQYADRTNKAIAGAPADVDGVTNSFAEGFVEASPAGIIIAKNDDTFKKKIPQGYSFYNKIGITSMDILSKKIELLDEIHALVKIHWDAKFTKKN